MLIGFGSRPVLPCLCRYLHPNFDHCIVVTITLIYFVHYHIINCVQKHRIIGGERIWVGEEEVEDGVDHGPEEGPSAICRLGKDQAGHMAEELAGGSLHHNFRQVFHKPLALSRRLGVHQLFLERLSCLF